MRVRYGDAERTLSYDKLIVATGATPIRPPIAGLDTAGVYVLHTIDDSSPITARSNLRGKCLGIAVS